MHLIYNILVTIVSIVSRIQYLHIISTGGETVEAGEEEGEQKRPEHEGSQESDQSHNRDTQYSYLDLSLALNGLMNE